MLRFIILTPSKQLNNVKIDLLLKQLAENNILSHFLETS
jgi:hypothetical protein